MKHALLPHDHGQNIETFLDRMPDNDEFIKVAEAFQQLGDGTRLKILCILCHSRECVSNIAAAVSMSNAAVSHHLQILKKSGLIVSERSGKEIYYTLADTREAALLHGAIDALFEIKCPRCGKPLFTSEED